MRYELDRDSIPPDGLWISPDGEAIPVTEHLITLKREPERFGLTRRDVSANTMQALALVAKKVIERGWTRFRLFSDHWAFEVDSLKNRLPLIEDILTAHGATPNEFVRVSQAKPRKEFEGTVDDVFERTIAKHFDLAGRKSRWRFS